MSISPHYPLFEHMSIEHDLVLTENELQEIVDVVRSFDVQAKKFTDWKESMMKVHSELDLQGIAKALELPLGSSIAPQVLPKVKELIEQNAELVEMLRHVVYEYEQDERTYRTIREIKEVLTKYNHLKSNTNE